MSSIQFQKPPGVLPTHPNAYPPNSYKFVTVWYLSLHTYLLVTLLVIQLISQWFFHSRRSSYVRRLAAREPVPPPDTTRAPPWMPKIRMAWKDPNQAVRHENIQAPGGNFRLEIDFNERVARPQPAAQVNTVEARGLRFGVEGHPAPIQELDASRVLMPGSEGTSQPNLRGGAVFQNTPETDNLDSPHHLIAYLQLEDLVEGIVRQFDELERHRNGSLLREALTGNERRSLVTLYRQLMRRLEHHMSSLGVETDDLEPDDLLREVEEVAEGRGKGRPELETDGE